MKKTITGTLDPGHGGKDPGAVNSSLGLTEADIVLSVCTLANQKLSNQGSVFNIVMTRDNDTFVSLVERPTISNKAKAKFFVSVHCNAASRKSAKGFEVFTTKRNNKSDVLATHICESFEEEFQDLVTRYDYSDGDPDKEANHAVTRRTDHASCLVELGFISNDSEAERMASKEWQDKASTALARGICKFVDVAYDKDLAKISTRPPTLEERVAALEYKMYTLEQ